MRYSSVLSLSLSLSSAVHVFVQDIITYEHSLSVMVAQEKEGGDTNRASVSIEDQEVSSINAKATTKGGTIYDSTLYLSLSQQICL